METASARGHFNLTSTTGTPSPAAATVAQRSPWHSPVPYLFGGLAAMLGLIAFALLILACSYWKLSGYLEGENNNGDNNNGERDIEAGDRQGKDEDEETLKKRRETVLEEKILVIMAGQVKPTFLAKATPVSSTCNSSASTSRSSSFGDNSTSSSSCSSCVGDKNESTEVARIEMVKQETHDHQNPGDHDEHNNN